MATKKTRTTKTQTTKAETSPTTEPKGAQVAPPPLEGIEFADGPAPDPRANAERVEETVERSVAADHANQAAAKAAIDRMQFDPNLRANTQAVVEVPVPTKSELAAIQKRLKVYRVVQPRRITRGASSYELAAGKQITNRDYDIENLRAQGVQLEEVGTA